MANINRSFIFTEETKVRGMLVPQRSESSVIEPNPMKSPFISMVTVKRPVGFNPVHKPVIIERKKENNEVFNRNRKYLKILQEKGIKKTFNDKPITSPIQEPVKLNKAQSMRLLKPIKQQQLNDNLKPKEIANQPSIPKEIIKNIEEEVKKEEKLKGEKLPITKVNIKEDKEKDEENKIEGPNEKEEETVKEVPKEMNKEQEDPLLSEHNLDEEEMNKILGFISNLDYDKYARDLEIREALQLIKNKMDKDNQDNEDNQSQHQIVTNQDLATQKPKQQTEPIKENEDSSNTSKLPELKAPIINKQEEEKNEEIKKLQLAEQISKCDPKIRAIHSYQSIKRLLEREGLNDIKLIDPLRITFIKEKGLAKDDDYIANKLPFLHSLPLI